MTQKIEVPVAGMDCADCTAHVRSAISKVPGVKEVDVFLGAEKAIIELERDQVDLADIRKAVESAGYSVPDDKREDSRATKFNRQIMILFGVVFGVVLLVVVLGELLGLFDRLAESIPWYIWLAVIAAAGYPVFRNVLRATLQGRIISHTLMTVGALAAVIAVEWTTAVIVVFFMRVGDFVESFTASRARSAVKSLTELAPQTARVERDGEEVEVPVDQVGVGDIVVVRPGEQIPVDGEVISGDAHIDQAAITGESMPVEAGKGTNVFAASMLQSGTVKVKATHIGADSTFGKVIKMVEGAEAHRADVQRVADKFSAYYLPIVLGIAVLTYVFSRDVMATVAVLVVACSCSFALATPIAMLASVGAGAKQGLLIKGGKYLESLSRVDVLLIDKTGTLTQGKPVITDVVLYPGSNTSRNGLLAMAASVERYSEHPLANATISEARNRQLEIPEPDGFESIPGQGVRANVNGKRVSVGNVRMIPAAAGWGARERLEGDGKAMLFVEIDGRLTGALAASDSLRPEVPRAIAQLGEMGVGKMELLTGDHERAASKMAAELGLDYQAGLLPEDKIRIVQEYQAKGKVVVMIGDGVNDAPALAQADVGIAMGAAGSDIAVEAGHIALLRDDWSLVPAVFGIAQRTMRVVRQNLIYTSIYNIAGLSLAAFGILPPVLAAAAQSIPDLGILGNSSRLIDRG